MGCCIRAICKAHVVRRPSENNHRYITTNTIKRYCHEKTNHRTGIRHGQGALCRPRSRHRCGSGQTAEHITLAALLAGRRCHWLREPRRAAFGRHSGNGQLPGQGAQHRGAASGYPHSHVAHTGPPSPEPACKLCRFPFDGRRRPRRAASRTLRQLDGLGRGQRHETRLQLYLVLAPKERYAHPLEPR